MRGCDLANQTIVLFPDLDLLDPMLHPSGRAHELYRILREDEPISWRGRYWAVMRHADIIAVAEDTRRFSSARGTNIHDVNARTPLRSIHISDPPLHNEMRSIVEASYGPAWLLGLADHIRGEAAARIARWSGVVDAVSTLADPLTFGVLERLLGEPAEALLSIIHRFARYDEPRYRRAGETPEACFRNADRDLWRVLEGLVARRTVEPRDDVPSRLLADQRLARRDLMYTLRFIVQTTYQSTSLAIAACIAALANEREQFRALPEHMTVRAADELLRWATPVIRFARHVVAETELAGIRLRAGDRVVMFFPSGNRDERVYVQPDHLDLCRAPNPHLAFGGGAHACLGAPLARLQVAAVIDALRGHEFELVEPPRAFASSVNAGFDRVLVRSAR
jgi:cholest-4-en-3-one 26-monooxygenase